MGGRRRVELIMALLAVTAGVVFAEALGLGGARIGRVAVVF
jgi:hypothetical protein